MTQSLRSNEIQSMTTSTGYPDASRQQAVTGFDYDANRFPYSIVWQPFPVLGWILPCIGHMGIADSSGVIYDFQGPHTIMCVSVLRDHGSAQSASAMPPPPLPPSSSSSPVLLLLLISC